MTASVFDFNTAKTLSQIEADQRSRATVDAADIKQRIHRDARSFVQWLFSGRAFCTKSEARIGDVYGTPGASLSVALAGQDAGLWKDHATGEGGDLIALYMAYMGYQDGRNFQLALKEIAAEFLKDPVQVERATWQRTAVDRIEEKKQTLGTKPREDLLELGTPVQTWKYFDTGGNVLASVVRYEPDGTPASKTYRPYCFKTVEGRTKWQMGAPTLRPLYRLPEISLASTIVLVEGEKCADALAAIGVEATTAMQGAEAPIEKTDWSPLNGKTVIVWPDNDEPGFTYGRRAAERLAALGCQVRLVNIPAGKPPKWDAADCVAEGSDAKGIINAAVVLEERAKPRMRLLTLDELEGLKPPTWLIDGVLTDNGMSIMWGRSGTYKSFVALDKAMCVATEGALWHGRTVRHGPVVYVAAEGAHGLAKRAIGWRKTKGKDLPAPDIRLLPHGIVLTGEDTEHLIAAILESGEKPALIILDTLARTFGSGDENKTADMNAYVSAADRLRNGTGAHVMIVHHSGKDEDRGERGNLALRGAADTVINVTRTNDRLSLINEAPKGKQKDAPEFPTIHLRTVNVAFEHQGEEQTTLILMADDTSAEVTPKQEQKLGKIEKAILKALSDASEPLGQTRLILMTKAEKSAVYKAVKSLVSKELVEEIEADNGRPTTWKLAETRG